MYSEIRWRIARNIESYLQPSLLDKFKAKCPCCAYRLENEEDAGAAMLVCMDGNNSLKRVQRRREREGGQSYVVELRDKRTRESPMFLERELVDRFKNEVRSQNQPIGNGCEGLPVADGDEASTCAERWVNLRDES